MCYNYCLFISILLTFSSILANMAPEGFERFLNYYFVETGTYVGHGIRFALRAGFQEIHSIEIDYNFTMRACKAFNHHKNVHIWHGDSAKILFDVIKSLDKPITFWLDGHNGTPDPRGGNNTPLLEELEQIKKHHIKTHTIIIDDMHCCGTILFDGISKENIIVKIKDINPDYVITYVDGGDCAEYKNNIMVAQVPSDRNS